MSVTYQIDPAHSSVQFSVRHMMISNVKGAFTRLSGKLVLDPDNPGASALEASIDAASIDTREQQRDAHLRSADFLDVANYPAITFRSRSLERKSEEEYLVTAISRSMVSAGKSRCASKARHPK
jgi:polyisoprenoid-binding protein YceI